MALPFLLPLIGPVNLLGALLHIAVQLTLAAPRDHIHVKWESIILPIRSIGFANPTSTLHRVGAPCPRITSVAVKFTREILMMEVSAAGESDEDPDDALSSTGDEFEG
ncbi:hypothetical protein B0H11DRAFT_1901517 [Mycena galericulata]|nr:hypothetical protein B0H11DRAFT_1901517 [Mycena galericulata]